MGAAGGIQQRLQPIHTNIPGLLQPISSFDQVEEFARRSTHRVLVPRWLTDVRAEDEWRTGRRTNNDGATVPYVYTVVGVRRNRYFGLRHTELFLAERE